MDGRGRIAQPLNWNSNLRARNSTANSVARLGRVLERWSWLLRTRLPRGAGTAAFVLLIAASVGYGVVKGEHVPELVEAFKSARDGVGNQAGFRIRSVSVSGHAHMSREEVLAAAGITGSTSLVVPGCRGRRANASRRARGSPTPASSSSIRASFRSASRSARASRFGRRTAGVGHRRRRHRARRVPRSRHDAVAARGRPRRETQAKEFLRAARPPSRAARVGARQRSWSESGAGTCG